LNLGYLAVIGAYLLWGLFPFYWYHLKHVDAFELIGHRIVWSFVALLIGLVIFGTASKESLLRFHRNKRNYLWSLAASILIGINWLLFIWAVQHDMIVEAALGYFITPLMSVALGVIILRESMPPVQWLAVGFAASGVSYITYNTGTIPGLALALATSFSVYGIVKKSMPLGALPGLWLETTILLLPAIGLLGWYVGQGKASFGNVNRMTDALILGGGPTTAVPLLLFAYGAQRIPLSQLGLLQYLAPSIQFIVGWLAFKERVEGYRWVGFGLVWIGLLIFAVFSARKARAASLVAMEEA
jgi:chloramphenicol-sensitive protein RarD